MVVWQVVAVEMSAAPRQPGGEGTIGTPKRDVHARTPDEHSQVKSAGKNAVQAALTPKAETLTRFSASAPYVRGAGASFHGASRRKRVKGRPGNFARGEQPCRKRWGVGKWVVAPAAPLAKGGLPANPEPEQANGLSNAADVSTASFKQDSNGERTQNVTLHHRK
jgi:hypothetical protein